jgi:hypothetical protein
VRLCGALANAWFPFLLPLSALKDGVGLLADGAASGKPGRSLPQIWPCLPTAVSSSPAEARALVSWWVGFYLTSMGPLYPRTLRAAGFGAAVDDVFAANPTHRTTEVPRSAEILLDELTIWGTQPLPERA